MQLEGALPKQYIKPDLGGHHLCVYSPRKAGIGEEKIQALDQIIQIILNQLV
jgi:hypothetical protein